MNAQKRKSLTFSGAEIGSGSQPNPETMYDRAKDALKETVAAIAVVGLVCAGIAYGQISAQQKAARGPLELVQWSSIDYIHPMTTVSGGIRLNIDTIRDQILSNEPTGADKAKAYVCLLNGRTDENDYTGGVRIDANTINLLIAKKERQDISAQSQYRPLELGSLISSSLLFSSGYDTSSTNAVIETYGTATEKKTADIPCTVIVRETVEGGFVSINVRTTGDSIDLKTADPAAGLCSMPPFRSPPSLRRYGGGVVRGAYYPPPKFIYQELDVYLTPCTEGVPLFEIQSATGGQPLTPPGTVQENRNDGLKYVWIPPGAFMMGCSTGDNECRDNEKPAHHVSITKGFWIGQTVVTVGAYKRFAVETGRQMPYAPNSKSGWANDTMPVGNVNWNDAHDYCTWAGARLPTEAEWEYAARGGSTDARYAPLDEVAWYRANSGGRVHPVGERRPNGFGLYDVLGNVWEWVNDWDENYYQNTPCQDGSGLGLTTGQERGLRGGSWGDDPGFVRVSERLAVPPDLRGGNTGFRCGGEVSAPARESAPAADLGSETPVIEHVTFSSDVGRNLRIDVRGHGFGQAPRPMPYTGDLLYFSFSDLGNFEAGHPGDAVGLNYICWASDRIDVAGFSRAYGAQTTWKAAPGDHVVVTVWNPSSGLKTTWEGVLPGEIQSAPSGQPPATPPTQPAQPSETPVIEHVTFSSDVGRNLRIDVRGHGFGQAPKPMPFAGDLPYFSLNDLGRFEAGNVSPSNWDAVGLNYVSWQPDRIVIAGFSGAYGAGSWKAAPGDRVVVTIWNPGSGRKTTWEGVLPWKGVPRA